MKKDVLSLKEETMRLAQKAEADLAGLLDKRAELDEEIVRLRQFLKGLQPILGDEYSPKIGRGSKRAPSEGEKVGLKEACLETLKTAYEALTATEVVNELRDKGFPIDKYSKPLSVVSITLKRLVKDGEVETEDKKGKIAYKWNWRNKKLPFG